MFSHIENWMAKNEKLVRWISSIVDDDTKIDKNNYRGICA